MAPSRRTLAPLATTVPFDKFWRWLQGHQNCILRAGTPEVVLFDREEFHWTLVVEDDTTYVVQVSHGKELVGELLVFPAEIAYVQAEPTDHEGEFLFECIAETTESREAVYHFVLAHEYDDGSHAKTKTEKWTH